VTVVVEIFLMTQSPCDFTMNAISCLTWVKRGGASRHPDRVRLAAEELSNLINIAEGKGDDDDDDNYGASEKESDDGASANDGDLEAVDDDDEAPPTGGGTSDDDDVDEDIDDDDLDDIDEKYGLSGYEDEDDITVTMAGIANPKDPYLQADDTDTDSEAGDLEIMPDDNLLVVGKVSNEFCNLEVHVYNENDNNLYCHHDVMLPSFPLSMEWLDFDAGEEEPGNFVAISSMTPVIEIWDIDVVNCLEPAFVLGSGMRKKKKMKSMCGHTDAVLDLSWNHLQRNVLASASADFTIGLWDLSEGKMASSFAHHEEKVQAIEWHPFEAQSLLSGGFDKTVRVYDCRSADVHKTWTLDGEVERVTWNQHNPYYFLASTDTGHVYYVDVRNELTVFTLKAHTAATTGLVLSSGIAGCLLTASSDKTIKLWDFRDDKPAIVHSQDMKMGELHCAQCCPDSPLLFAVGGEREFRVFNLKKNAMVAKCFDLCKKVDSEVLDSDSNIKDKTGKNEKGKKKKKTTVVAAELENDGGTEGVAKKKKNKKKTLTEEKKMAAQDSDTENVPMKKRKKKQNTPGEACASQSGKRTVTKKDHIAITDIGSSGNVTGKDTQCKKDKKKKKIQMK